VLPLVSKAEGSMNHPLSKTAGEAKAESRKQKAEIIEPRYLVSYGKFQAGLPKHEELPPLLTH